MTEETFRKSGPSWSGNQKTKTKKVYSHFFLYRDKDEIKRKFVFS